jgi:hypothetical protein
MIKKINKPHQQTNILCAHRVCLLSVGFSIGQFQKFYLTPTKNLNLNFGGMYCNKKAAKNRNNCQIFQNLALLGRLAAWFTFYERSHAKIMTAKHLSELIPKI